jgi:hypothetical protein
VVVDDELLPIVQFPPTVRSDEVTLLAVNDPVAYMLPLTYSFSLGLDVFIPTLPELLMVIATTLVLTQKLIPNAPNVCKKSPPLEFCIKIWPTAVALSFEAAVSCSMEVEPFTSSL